MGAHAFTATVLALAHGHPPVHETLDRWTSRNLVALQSYLSAFAGEAHAWGCSTAYIDVFSSAGYCATADSHSSGLGGFPELAKDGPKAFLKHAVRGALRTEPAFDGYMFIERDRHRLPWLDALRHEFRHRNVQIRRIEANREIERLAHLDWNMRRAVLFVDAYAASLEWDTIVAVSRALTIDLWVLLPVGFGQSTCAEGASVPQAWRERVSHLLGRPEWSSELDGPTPHIDQCINTLNQSVSERLRGSFARVAAPAVVRTEDGAPLYAVQFASSATRSGATARTCELASQLLEVIGS